MEPTGIPILAARWVWIIYDALSGILMKRFVQYMKDRTEALYDYFPCPKERCRLDHAKVWLNSYTLSFTLFRHSDAVDLTSILQLSKLI